MDTWIGVHRYSTFLLFYGSMDYGQVSTLTSLKLAKGWMIGNSIDEHDCAPKSESSDRFKRARNQCETHI